MKAIARVERLRNEVRDHLENGIIPFWLARAEDKECGGFLTNFDEHGVALDTPEKYLNTQCRLIWWFSQLHRRSPSPASARLARLGVDFLITHPWDGTHAGFTWKCRRDGSSLDDGKIVYGESFAIYALSEYYLATRDPRGLEYAGRVFDLLQKHCAETRYGFTQRSARDFDFQALILANQ
jgi:mannobiose 2-epimerase